MYPRLVAAFRKRMFRTLDWNMISELDVGDFLCSTQSYENFKIMINTRFYEEQSALKYIYLCEKLMDKF